MTNRNQFMVLIFLGAVLLGLLLLWLEDLLYSRKTGKPASQRVREQRPHVRLFLQTSALLLLGVRLSLVPKFGSGGKFIFVGFAVVAGFYYAMGTRQEKADARVQRRGPAR